MDFKQVVCKTKNSIYRNTVINNPDEFFDKYDASKHKTLYVFWLLQTGQAEVNSTIEDIIQKRINGNEIEFELNYKNKLYHLWFPDGDRLEYPDYDGLDKEFEKYVDELKEKGEYYFPETEIRRYEAPKIGTKILKTGKDTYILADRNKVYEKISGTPTLN